MEISLHLNDVVHPKNIIDVKDTYIVKQLSPRNWHTMDPFRRDLL